MADDAVLGVEPASATEIDGEISRRGKGYKYI